MFKFIKTTLLCFIANGFANAQTAHTITYASSGLPTNSSICNVFNI